MYFLDYIGPKGFARSVADYCKEVIVLDHHKTAVEELEGCQPLPSNMQAHLDMHRSGATIARDYFGIDVVLPDHTVKCGMCSIVAREIQHIGQPHGSSAAQWTHFE